MRKAVYVVETDCKEHPERFVHLVSFYLFFFFFARCRAGYVINRRRVYIAPVWAHSVRVERRLVFIRRRPRSAWDRGGDKAETRHTRAGLPYTFGCTWKPARGDTHDYYGRDTVERRTPAGERTDQCFKGRRCNFWRRSLVSRRFTQNPLSSSRTNRKSWDNGR